MSDLRIVLLGKTGSGKSSAGNTILGSDVFKEGYFSISTTKQCEKQEGNVDGRSISVIDTPGLFHTSIKREEYLKAKIEKSLQFSAPGPHVFLLVIRLGRFTEEEQNTVKWIQKNFGEEVMRFTIVLFTGADKLAEKTIEQFLQENTKLKELLDEHKTVYCAFDNTEKTDGSQVTELLKKINAIVMKNGGQQHYTKEMYQETQRKIAEEEERMRQEAASLNKQEREEKRNFDLKKYIRLNVLLGGLLGISIRFFRYIMYYYAKKSKK